MPASVVAFAIEPLSGRRSACPAVACGHNIGVRIERLCARGAGSAPLPARDREHRARRRCSETWPLCAVAGMDAAEGFAGAARGAVGCVVGAHRDRRRRGMRHARRAGRCICARPAVAASIHAATAHDILRLSPSIAHSDLIGDSHGISSSFRRCRARISTRFGRTRPEPLTRASRFRVAMCRASHARNPGQGIEPANKNAASPRSLSGSSPQKAKAAPVVGCPQTFPEYSNLKTRAVDLPQPWKRDNALWSFTYDTSNRRAIAKPAI